MYKLLIVTPNLKLTKKLINKVIGNISNIQIVGILSTKSDFDYFQHNPHHDFILFHECDYTCYPIDDNISGIICVGNFDLPIQKNFKGISISNTCTPNFMIKEITKFSQKLCLNFIRQKANEILLNLGFSFKHIGTKYIADAICYCFSNGDCEFENFERDIFPYIAKLNNTRVKNVKWSITRTTNFMYFNHTTKSLEKLEEYFYLNRFEKPTPKQMIGTITNNLLVQYQDYFE